ncbi:MAG: CHASE2 domain-containing protein [Myxococcota bacterium]
MIQSLLRNRPFVYVLVCVLGSFLFHLLVGTGYLQRAEEKRLYNQKMQIRRLQPKPFSSRVVVVELDERSEHAKERWPWSWSRMAKLLRHLRESKPQVIALDLSMLGWEGKATSGKKETLLKEFRVLMPPLKPLSERVRRRMRRRARKRWKRKQDLEQQRLSFEKKLESSFEDGRKSFFQEVQETPNVVLGYRYYATEKDILGIDAKAYQKSLASRKKNKAQKTKPTARENVLKPASRTQAAKSKNKSSNNVLSKEDANKQNTPVPRRAKKVLQQFPLFSLIPQTLHEKSMSPEVPEALYLRAGGGSAYSRYHGFLNVTDTPWRPVYQVPLLMRAKQRYYPSLPLATYLVAYPEQRKQLRMVERSGGFALLLGSNRIPLDRQARYRVNYHGSLVSIPEEQRISADDVVKKSYASGKVEGKIVLVGQNHWHKGARVQTPFAHTLPRVHVHAMMLSNWLQNQPLVREGQRNFVELLGLLVLGVLLAFAMGLGGPVIGGVVCGFMVFGIGLADRYLFFPADDWMYWGYVQWTLVGGFLSAWLLPAWLTGTSRRAQEHYLSNCVSRDDQTRLRTLAPAFLQEQSSGTLGCLTLRFCFPPQVWSSGTETLLLQKALTQFLPQVREAVWRNHGMVLSLNSHEGMVVFHPVLCGQDVATAMTQSGLQVNFLWRDFIHKFWHHDELPLPVLALGAALGEATLSRMGTDTNYALGAAGQAVAESERLCMLSKVYRSAVLVNEHAHADLEKGNAFFFRELDWVFDEEAQASVVLYEVLGKQLEPAQQEAANYYVQGLQSYRGRDFKQAEAFFQTALQHWSMDGPAAMMVKRAQHYQSYPPSFQWNGVWTMVR